MNQAFSCLLLVSVLYVSETSSSEGANLSADCSEAGKYDGEVTVCQCNNNKRIDCGVGKHVVISDVIFGTFNAETHCDHNGVCSRAISCEYKMSNRCDDKQFIDIIEPCNGRQACEVHNSVSRKMTCPRGSATADYTTVQFRCAKNTAPQYIDVCREGQTPQEQGKHAHLASPSFPNPDFTKKNRLCCCNITQVEEFYLLHYDTRRSTGPHVQFGEVTALGLQRVDFKNKLANVHINTYGLNTYSLTWQQDRESNSGVFLASLVGHGSNYVSVTCGSTGCPQPSLPPQTTIGYDITASPPTTIPGVSATAAGNPATIANAAEHAADDDSNDKPPIALYAGIAGGAVALIIAIVTIVLLVRRRQKQKHRGNEPGDIYTEPTKRGDGSNAFTSPSDYERQQPPVPTKPPNITDTDDDYTYVEAQDTAPQLASTGDTTKKPLIPKVHQGAYQMYEDPDSKAYETLDDDENINCVDQGTAAKQNDPAYQEYDATYEVSNTGGDSAPYQEYDASEPAEDYSYANRYRPTKIIQQVQDNPPVVANDYETGSSCDYATVD